MLSEKFSKESICSRIWRDFVLFSGVFFIGFFFLEQFCGESDLQSDSETFRVSVCVLDRFRSWSNFCDEIDLQSDLELL